MGRRACPLVLAVLLSAACTRSEPAAPPSQPSPTPPSTTSAIPAASRQLVTAIVPDWTATTAELRLWTREPGGAWTAAGPAWSGVIGRTGAAWGTGLHGTGAPRGRTGPSKHEGDGKSPAGVFTLAASFGYAATPPARAALPYTRVDARWKCVDDPASRHYNVILDDQTVTADWTSAEDMRRADDRYTWVLEVGHNAARTRGDGSCIFLHVWGGPDSATVGCTAMPEDKLAGLLSSLSAEASPTFVLLPRDEYAALAPAWSLPGP